MRESLVGGNRGRAEPSRIGCVQCPGDGLPQRAPRRRHLCGGAAAGLDLQPEFEATVLRQKGEQMVEDRHAGLDVRAPLVRERCAHP